MTTQPQSHAATAQRSPGPLTNRERTVLPYLSRGLTLEQIATELFVTRNTVKSQVASLYRKLGVSRRADAVAVARTSGLACPKS